MRPCLEWAPDSTRECEALAVLVSLFFNGLARACSGPR